MEFHEKLQELRKRRGLTQEELAEALYVSRTAVPKWESGRGYPSIDSLKEIYRYFSVTIDDLLSGETLISIAETENKRNIQNLFDLLFGMTDLLSVLLIVLPLYPRTVEGYIYSVNLFEYTETSVMNRFLYWMLILGLILLGAWKVLTVQLKMEKDQKIIQKYSLTLSIAAVVVLALAGETYAVTVAFLLLVMKTVVFCKYLKSGC